MQAFTGTGVALVTPFTENNTVDTKALAAIVNYVIDGGVDYLVVLGTTAETATLTETEKLLVINTIISANNSRLPLVLGVGGNNTQQVIEDLKTIDLSAFQAILSVSPYYNKPTQQGIYEHFKHIAQQSPLPIILYNVPSRTGSNMLPETVLRLANDFANIIGIKEATGDIVQAMRLLQHKPENFLVISGDDMITLPLIFAGGSGVISVIGQGYPKQFSTMVGLALDKKVDAAYNLHYAIMDSIDMIFEQGNPAGIKEIFKLLGLSNNTVRLPLVNVSKDLSDRLNKFNQQLNTKIL